MVNKVILVGNLGRDPELRTTPSGQQVANFSLATNRKWSDRDGNRQAETEWHNIIVWGRLAEIAGQYLSKGRQIFVEGRIQTRSWEDRESGEKKYRTEVVANNFQMLGQRGDSEGGGAYPGRDTGPPWKRADSEGDGAYRSPEPADASTSGTASAPASGTASGPPAGAEDDDIPF